MLSLLLELLQLRLLLLGSRLQFLAASLQVGVAALETLELVSGISDVRTVIGEGIRMQNWWVGGATGFMRSRPSPPPRISKLLKTTAKEILNLELL